MNLMMPCQRPDDRDKIKRAKVSPGTESAANAHTSPQLRPTAKKQGANWRENFSAFRKSLKVNPDATPGAKFLSLAAGSLRRSESPSITGGSQARSESDRSIDTHSILEGGLDSLERGLGQGQVPIACYSSGCYLTKQSGNQQGADIKSDLGEVHHSARKTSNVSYYFTGC